MSTEDKQVYTERVLYINLTPFSAKPYITYYPQSAKPLGSFQTFLSCRANFFFFFFFVQKTDLLPRTMEMSQKVSKM